MNVAIIGLGVIGNVHVKAIGNNAKIVAVCDIDESKKEEITIFYGGYGDNEECSTLIFLVNPKGFGALKMEDGYITRYYNYWSYDERYFLEENGELFFCYTYPAGVTKSKISLDKKNKKVIVENHDECINFIQKETDIGTTAAP